MLIERRSSRRLMNQINVVPYIDVMLVLLVIFMVTAPLINPGQIELPSVVSLHVPTPHSLSWRHAVPRSPRQPPVSSRLQPRVPQAATSCHSPSVQRS